MAFDALFQPGRIRSITIPNRIVMPAMTTRTADEEGFVTEDSIAYYRARAEGGVGLITVEMASPERAGRHRRFELGICEDKFIPGLARLTDMIHQNGSKASIQLGHAGGHTRVDISGEQPIAPSAIPHPVQEVTFETIIPEEMSRVRIEKTVAAFAAAAQRAEQAGFDCVEIHGAHGYLISQFLTPFENRRTDEYGGSLENRARFGLDVLRAIKEATRRVAVIFRLSVNDYFPEGMPYQEGRQVAFWVAENGADALHIAAGHYRSLPSAARQMPPMADPDATFLNYAADIRPHVNIPVIAVGRLGRPEIAAAAIESKKADFIALGRSLIADPRWPKKVCRGVAPRSCLACNSCVNEMRNGSRLGCVINGGTGRERLFDPNNLPSGRRIAVIGAGPAGLTYASLVAEKNQVIVFERDDSAGGSFRYSGKAPMFENVEARQSSFDRYIESMVAACRRKGVQFSFGIDVARKPDMLADFDDIVVASGASYRFGLEHIIKTALDLGVGNWFGIRNLLSRPDIREWFYYRARLPTNRKFRALKRAHQNMIVIGDAMTPGKSRQATRSAFDAAFSANMLKRSA